MSLESSAINHPFFADNDHQNPTKMIKADA